MKAKEFWNYSDCNIGHPCIICINSCGFKIIPQSRKIDQEEKEKENERISECSEERH